MSKGTTTDNQPTKPEQARRRAWREPTVKSGTLFEMNSLACAKVETEEGCQAMGAIKSS